MEGTCFVIQRFDGGHYDALYREVFEPAIKAAKLEPYRVDSDPSASIPVEAIEQRITESTACFAELSEDNPNVWFELGYAIAREKPLCLVCNSVREAFPFDVQHRRIIRYPLKAMPSDFEKLRAQVAQQLVAAVEKVESVRRDSEIAESMSMAPTTDGLQPHELIALTIVFEENYQLGISPWSLDNEIKKRGYTRPAASLAISGLKRKNLLVFREVKFESGESGNNLFVSELGEKWLLENQHRLNLRAPQKIKGEISDEDIPF